jgi:hypothetical protein
MKNFPLSRAAVVAVTVIGLQHVSAETWQVHDLARPQPPVVTPKPESELAAAAKAPAGATVLFDGGNLAAWEQAKGGPAQWKVVDGAFQVVPKTGTLRTKEGFGSGHLHIEWRAPKPRPGNGQDGSNSGVFFMGGRYEVQVLDSYENPTYADGTAGAVYGQNPPSANPIRPPGEWNTYDIDFVAPKFSADGKLESPARFTVVFNGVKVQDDFALSGPTAHKARPPYAAHSDRLPLELQDHGCPVQFRNIWFVPAK